MQADLPHTLYKPVRGAGRKDKDAYRQNPNDRAMALQEEANRRARERREAEGGGETTYTKEELLRK